MSFNSQEKLTKITTERELKGTFSPTRIQELIKSARFSVDLDRNYDPGSVRSLVARMAASISP